MISKPDSTKQMVHFLTEELSINNSYLAGMLGVSEKSLNDWKSLPMGDLTPKAKRLMRLFQVISYLKTNFKEVSHKEYKNVLLNGRIVLDPNDEEDGTTSLMSFVISEPEAKAWPAIVEAAVNSLEIKNFSKGYESNGPKKISATF